MAAIGSARVHKSSCIAAFCRTTEDAVGFDGPPVDAPSSVSRRISSRVCRGRWAKSQACSFGEQLERVISDCSRCMRRLAVSFRPLRHCGVRGAGRMAIGIFTSRIVCRRARASPLGAANYWVPSFRAIMMYARYLLRLPTMTRRTSAMHSTDTCAEAAMR